MGCLFSKYNNDYIIYEKNDSINFVPTSNLYKMVNKFYDIDIIDILDGYQFVCKVKSNSIFQSDEILHCNLSGCEVFQNIDKNKKNNYKNKLLYLMSNFHHGDLIIGKTLLKLSLRHAHNLFIKIIRVKNENVEVKLYKKVKFPYEDEVCLNDNGPWAPV
jgi:hypothetical protein